MSRGVVVLPGRDVYASSSLGSLPASHRFVEWAEELRGAYDGLESLVALDRAERFDPQRHLRPANAAPLIYLASLLDVEAAAEDHDLVAVVGNSLGWYSALAVTGVLAFEDAYRLVQEVALLQEQSASADGPGGQLVYPLTDADWRPDPPRAAAVRQALAVAGDEAYRSVELGAYVVLAGTEAGLASLVRELPPARVGERLFPLRLALHGPYHTPLAGQVAAAARPLLADLSWRSPSVTLIDGRGVRHTPFGAEPAEIARYTLDEQLVTTYDFAASLRVALREHAPDLLILPGPPDATGGICAQLIVGEGYRGIRDRASFEAAQAGPHPLLLSVRR